MKKQQPRKSPGDISAAWFVIPLSIAAAVLIAMGDQPVDIPFPSSSQAAPVPVPAVPAVHQPPQPRSQGMDHAKVS
ncbi:MAG TPA: hypothetical protein VF522_18420 [Ramlibacter sp.]|uniref:hypothetical protein n=1 Tax=Ramlibacter sp. TaxID=1917967 RepID=UPI002ED309C4